jgi:hypothetical protein
VSKDGRCAPTSANCHGFAASLRLAVSNLGDQLLPFVCNCDSTACTWQREGIRSAERFSRSEVRSLFVRASA